MAHPLRSCSHHDDDRREAPGDRDPAARHAQVGIPLPGGVRRPCFFRRHLPDPDAPDSSGVERRRDRSVAARGRFRPSEATPPGAGSTGTTPSAVSRRETKKARRLLHFAQALPRMRRAIARDLSLPGLPREKVLACVLRILSNCFLRPGSQVYAEEHGSFGVATLRRRHVSSRGDAIALRLPRQVREAAEAGDAGPARRADRPGAARELPAATSSSSSRRTVRGGRPAPAHQRLHQGRHGGAFQAKDFRTWAGTLICACALARAGVGEGETRTARRRKIVAAIRETADHLGNTLADCRASYISRSVLTSYEKGRVDGAPLPALEDSSRAVAPGFHASEKACCACSKSGSAAADQTPETRSMQEKMASRNRLVRAIASGDVPSLVPHRPSPGPAPPAPADAPAGAPDDEPLTCGCGAKYLQALQSNLSIILGQPAGVPGGRGRLRRDRPTRTSLPGATSSTSLPARPRVVASDRERRGLLADRRRGPERGKGSSCSRRTWATGRSAGLMLAEVKPADPRRPRSRHLPRRRSARGAASTPAAGSRRFPSTDSFVPTLAVLRALDRQRDRRDAGGPRFRQHRDRRAVLREEAYFPRGPDPRRDGDRSAGPAGVHRAGPRRQVPGDRRRAARDRAGRRPGRGVPEQPPPLRRDPRAVRPGAPRPVVLLLPLLGRSLAGGRASCVRAVR